MTSYVKQQIAKKLAMYFKDMTADKLDLSVLKGTVVMKSIELQETFLRSALLLPPWLFVKTASCNTARCKLSLSRIKSQPMLIDIDTITIVIDVVDPEDQRSHYKSDENRERSHSFSTAATQHKPEKYGIGDTVADGLTVNIKLIHVAISTPDFSATFVVQDVNVESVSAEWLKVTDMHQTRIVNQTKEIVTLYKQESQNSIAEFALQAPQIRIIRRRSLLDNNITFGSKVQFLPGVIKIELHREQLQILQIVAHSISQLAEAYTLHFPSATPPTTPDCCDTKTVGIDSAARHGPTHLKGSSHHFIKSAIIDTHKHFEEIPRSSIGIQCDCTGCCDYTSPDTKSSPVLATLIAQEIQLWHVAALPWTAAGSTPAHVPFDLKFNATRDAWMQSLGYTSDSVVNRSMTCSTTRAALGRVSVICDTGSTSQNGSQCSQQQETTILLQPRYNDLLGRVGSKLISTGDGSNSNTTSFNLDDHHMLLLEYQTFDVTHIEQRSDVPPPCLFVRISPILVQVHMGAVMRMAHFIQHTILRGLNGIFSANADRLFDAVASAQSEDEIMAVAERISNCSVLDALEVLQLRAACTRRIKAIRMPGLYGQSAHTNAVMLERMVNYVYVILNPLAEIPALSNGPDHVKNRKWHLSADEVSITNTPINQTFVPNVFRPLFQSTFFASAPATNKGTPLHPWTAEDKYQILPKPEAILCPLATFLKIKQVGLESIVPGGPSAQILKASIIDIVHRKLACKTFSQKPPTDTTSFTLLCIPRFHANLDNEDLFFATRLIEDFQRHSTFFDSGQPVPYIHSTAIFISELYFGLSVRAPPSTSLHLRLGSKLLESATSRHLLQLLTITTGPVEIAQFSFERSDCTIGNVSSVYIAASHLPSSTNDTNLSLPPSLIQLRLHNILPTPKEAREFFRNLDSRREKSYVSSIQPSTPMRSNDTQVEVPIVAENDVCLSSLCKVHSEEHIQDESLITLSEHSDECPKHNVSDNFSPDLQDTDENIMKSSTCAVALVNSQPILQNQYSYSINQDEDDDNEMLDKRFNSNSVCDPDADTTAHAKTRANNEEFLRYNSWNGLQMEHNLQQSALETAEMQALLESISERDNNVCDRSQEIFQQLPALGSGCQTFNVVNIRVHLSKSHLELLSTMFVDVQEGIPPPPKEIELENVSLVILDQDTFTEQHSPLQLTDILEVTCPAMTVSIQQEPCGSSKIRLCNCNESQPKIPITTNRDDVSTAYLEECLHCVIKEKCNLQQALEDLSAEMVRLKEENEVLHRRLKLS